MYSQITWFIHFGGCLRKLKHYFALLYSQFRGAVTRLILLQGDLFGLVIVHACAKSVFTASFNPLSFFQSFKRMKRWWSSACKFSCKSHPNQPTPIFIECFLHPMIRNEERKGERNARLGWNYSPFSLPHFSLPVSLSLPPSSILMLSNLSVILWSREGEGGLIILYFTPRQCSFIALCLSHSRCECCDVLILRLILVVQNTVRHSWI